MKLRMSDAAGPLQVDLIEKETYAIDHEGHEEHEGLEEACFPSS